uniref:Putative opioid-binding protein/cell adhesion molecule n=1 Tax=Corethrella appendiculata TaxID=1370023 RepID=U5ESW6_9DIPT
MKFYKIICISFCIFASVLQITTARTQINSSKEGSSRQIPLPDSEDYEDYEDNENEDSVEKAPVESTDSNIVHGGAYLEKTHDEITVKPGEDVQLDCNVINKSASTLILWFNGTNLLIQDKLVLTNDKRVSLTDTGSLMIRNVNADDTNTYVCQVLPGTAKTLNITLGVLSPPKSVKIYYDDNDISDTVFNYNQSNKHLALRCEVEGGHPKSTLTWSSNGDRIESHHHHNKNHEKKHIYVRSNILIFESLSRHETATYQCLADNGIDSPVHASVSVVLQHHPIIVKHTSYVNTGEGYDAELSCEYVSNPAVEKITWHKRSNKDVINERNSNNKYEIRNDEHGGHNRTRLIIKNINQTDIYEYWCRIENALGHQYGKIILGFQPSPSHFNGYEYRDDKLYTNWTVRSIQPLTELQILYKTPTTGWRVKTATLKDTIETHEGLWKITGEIDLPAGEWEITSRAQNTAGWALDEFVHEHNIKIPDNSIAHSKSTNVAAIQIRSNQLGIISLLLLALTSISCTLYN